jgi:hypothetical protein
MDSPRPEYACSTMYIRKRCRRGERRREELLQILPTTDSISLSTPEHHGSEFTSMNLLEASIAR